MKKYIYLFLTTSLILVGCAEEGQIEPDIDPRDKFIGTWAVKEEIAGQATQNYSSIIVVDSSNTSKIKIGNIYNLGAGAKLSALVAGNTLEISSQSITGISIAGTGSYAGTSFILNYTAIESSETINVKATYTK
jgi:hypothetical protein